MAIIADSKENLQYNLNEANVKWNNINMGIKKHKLIKIN